MSCWWKQTFAGENKVLKSINFKPFHIAPTAHTQRSALNVFILNHFAKGFCWICCQAPRCPHPPICMFFQALYTGGTIANRFLIHCTLYFCPFSSFQNQNGIICYDSSSEWWAPSISYNWSWSKSSSITEQEICQDLIQEGCSIPRPLFTFHRESLAIVSVFVL